MNTSLRKTSLYQRHVNSAGRMVDFGGWSMPVEYTGILKEAQAVRTTCGLFDASHMGEIRVRGKHALPFLQRVLTNDVAALARGRMQYNLLLNDAGGVIDDLMVYNFGGEYLLVVNASNTDAVFAWLKEHKTEGIELANESDMTALICLQGPAAEQAAQAAFGEILDTAYMHFDTYQLLGKEVLVSRSGYTGEDGFELYSSWLDALPLWDALVSCGSKFGLAACGLGARDILRIEAGYPLYGHEIDTSLNPLEAGLGWAVKLAKGSFIGKEPLLEIQSRGMLQKRVGFLMQERGIARQGYELFFQDKLVGTVTSGTFSPCLQTGIGMAYVDSACAVAGSAVQVSIRDKLYAAKITAFPFVPVRVKK